ncbi:MAG: biotin transporter BioY [Deltaproteobacteria bacterium]|nr:biotin transporter BioY [Deltaproteobacteria bacterium]MBT4267030.1 biotin transporter BioY [Deltaproteobacteria bacterium]MBT4641913.1 biotin transporter BioY [Deltaproteobacteria bacterium]MBT6505107.1 biotin transporter BioY [Deltaproteobacteria bacterium]MBT6611173.1 biotin transporter BioY [Deltaproteobacteria bacterium]
MTTSSASQLRLTVYASLFAALISAGAFMAIPIGPVPIVLQNMFVLLAGILLGWKWGGASVLIYLLAGAVGFPVFSAGRGGIVHLFGPTGGYLLSYIPAVMVVGIVSGKFAASSEGSTRKEAAGNALAMILGSAIVYGIGVPWLKLLTGLSWGKAIAVGMLPFLIGDALKIIAAVYIVRLLRSRIRL